MALISSMGNENPLCNGKDNPRLCFECALSKPNLSMHRADLICSVVIKTGRTITKNLFLVYPNLKKKQGASASVLLGIVLKSSHTVLAGLN